MSSHFELLTQLGKRLISSHYVVRQTWIRIINKLWYYDSNLFLVWLGVLSTIFFVYNNIIITYVIKPYPANVGQAANSNAI